MNNWKNIFLSIFQQKNKQKRQTTTKTSAQSPLFSNLKYYLAAIASFIASDLSSYENVDSELSGNTIYNANVSL